MKKILTLVMVMAIMLALVACGEETPKDTTPATIPPVTAATVPADLPKLAIGETASTDFMDLTIVSAEFADAVSDQEATYMTPTDAESKFTAPEERTYIALTYTVTLKGDVESFSFEGLPGFVKYGEETIPLKCYHITQPKGFNINMSAAAVVDAGTGDVISVSKANSHLFHKGDTVTFRTFEIVKLDPAANTDAFDLIVSIPNAAKDKVQFEYNVPAK